MPFRSLVRSFAAPRFNPPAVGCTLLDIYV
jgi:hypothetical protein